MDTGRIMLLIAQGMCMIPLINAMIVISLPITDRANKWRIGINVFSVLWVMAQLSIGITGAVMVFA